MKHVKIILFFMVFMLFIGIETYEAKITCEYTDGIKIEFNNESKKAYNKEGIPFTDELLIHFDVLNREDCPEVLYLALLISDVAYTDKCGFYDYLPQFDDISVASFDFVSSLSTKVNCGNITEIPKKIPELTNYCFTIMQVAVPVILIIMGSIDLVKGLYAQKEDEIKKGQKIFLKKLIVGLIIFFVVVIVKLLISAVAENSSQNIVECIDCFLNGVENCS